MASLGFEGSVDRLEGSNETVGGLIKKGGSKHVFKTPTASLLGLQKLAEEKRKRKEELEREQVKKSKRDKSDLENEKDKGDFDEYKERFSSGCRINSSSSKYRHYRSQQAETPSHTGGVSEEAREKQLRRLDRDKETRKGGVYAESRKEKDRNNDRSEKYYSDSYKTKRGKYDDGRDKYNDRRRERSNRESRRSEWEETPSRSSRRTTYDEPSTPHYRSRGKIIKQSLFVAMLWPWECGSFIWSIFVHFCFLLDIHVFEYGGKITKQSLFVAVLWSCECGSVIWNDMIKH